MGVGVKSAPAPFFHFGISWLTPALCGLAALAAPHRYRRRINRQLSRLHFMLCGSSFASGAVLLALLMARACRPVGLAHQPIVALYPYHNR